MDIASHVKRWPAQSTVVRKELAKRDICPECGGSLDTGFECNDCGFDAMELATGNEEG